MFPAFVREHMWHKALLMVYLMRLELTLVSSINDLWVGQVGLYRGRCPFPGVCLLWSALPVFDI